MRECAPCDRLGRVGRVRRRGRGREEPQARGDGGSTHWSTKEEKQIAGVVREGSTIDIVF